MRPNVAKQRATWSGPSFSSPRRAQPWILNWSTLLLPPAGRSLQHGSPPGRSCAPLWRRSTRTSQTCLGEWTLSSSPPLGTSSTSSLWTSCSTETTAEEATLPRSSVHHAATVTLQAQTPCTAERSSKAAPAPREPSKTAWLPRVPSKAASAPYGKSVNCQEKAPPAAQAPSTQAAQDPRKRLRQRPATSTSDAAPAPRPSNPPLGSGDHRELRPTDGPLGDLPGVATTSPSIAPAIETDSPAVPTWSLWKGISRGPSLSLSPPGVSWSV